MSDIVVEQDLRHRFGPARDQGPRPTCLVFAISDAHAAIRNGWEPLSCEYLYYHAISRDGTAPGVGTKPGTILAAVEHDGQPVEAGWPYLAQIPSDAASWRPPASVGEVFRRAGEAVGRAFDDAWSLIMAGRPAVICMTLSDAFYQPQDGIVDSTEVLDPIRRHAVVAVASGFRSHSRLLLVRNSWGSDWGKNGHAWLTEAYLAPRVLRVLALREGV